MRTIGNQDHSMIKVAAINEFKNKLYIINVNELCKCPKTLQ